MDINISRKAAHDLYSTPLLQQTAFWSDVKNGLGFRPMAFDITTREKDIRSGCLSSAHLVDDMLIFVRPINAEESIAYVPCGPLLTPYE